MLIAAVAYLALTGWYVDRKIAGLLNELNTLGSGDSAVEFAKFTTISAVSVTTSSGRALATTTEAQYRSFQNNSALNVYLNCNADAPAVANQGILLAASSTVEFSTSKGNMCFGSVTAISPGGTVTLLVNQK